MNNYKVFQSKSALACRYGEREDSRLAIGILDVTFSVERLEQVASWFLKNMNFHIHIICREDRYNELTERNRWTDISFIVFPSSSFPGEKINAFAAECRTNYFLVVRSDCDLIRFDGLNIFKMMDQKDHPALICPVLANSLREVVPSVRIPGYKDSVIITEGEMPSMESEVNTLYPVMEVGLYDRALFQRLRGFDEHIHSDYFQTLDFGIRCWMQDYKIKITPMMLFQFPDTLSLLEDITRDEDNGFVRCYTKALCVTTGGEGDGKHNVIRKIRYGYDRQTVVDEVKGRLLWLIKKDYPTLVSTWKM